MEPVSAHLSLNGSAPTVQTVYLSSVFFSNFLIRYPWLELQVQGRCLLFVGRI